MTSPQRFINRMIIFLVLAAVAIGFTYEIVWRIFLYNPALNGLILGVLLVGIFYIFRRLYGIKPEIRWIDAFRTSQPGFSLQAAPRLLAPVAAALGEQERRGRIMLPAMSVRYLLDSISARLDESRDISRYQIGLLIFLGLLGTFWGLLETISSVSRVINGLSVGEGDLVVVFDELKAGLAAPMAGMGTAFSSSLFGLAGSLVLGFLDLQATQGQNSFYNEMEEWLSGLTRLTGRDPGHGASEINIPAYVQAMLEQTAENLENLQRTVLRSEENQAAVHSGLIALTERLTSLGDQIATEQALLARLISSQEELRPLLGRLVETESGGFDETTRNHIRNMDVYLARILDETVQGRSQMTHELRSEIKMVARTIAAVAGEPRALSTLLLVIIFLLVVFVLAQFFLNQLLQGKDSKLASLEQAIAGLTEQLNMEEATTAELRLSVAQLTSDLQSAQADRDDTASLLAETEAERDDFRQRLFALQDEKALLTRTLNELRDEAARSGELQAELERTTDLRAKLEEELRRAQQTIATDKGTLDVQLAQLIQLRRDIEALQSTRHELELRVAEMATLLEAAESAKGAATEEIARLANLLEAARKETATLESRVAELDRSVAESGRKTQDLASEVTRLTQLLEGARQEKAAAEQQVQELTSALESTRAERGDLSGEVARLNALLSRAQADNEARERRVSELSSQLDTARDDAAERERRVAELAALLREERQDRGETAATAEELQRAREQLLLELSQVRSRATELESKLAGEQERTVLAQREVEQRDQKIADLLRAAGRNEEALATEQALSREALNQVEILNRQINALRVQLASLEQALNLEQQKVEEQQVTITDLGSKLNMALAGKVEELSRFRSEFFGRLRQLLGDRPDVRIVGDRFVFQSEVLFPSAAATIEPSGRDELRKLADSLRQISEEIPSDLPWVLQINGHTDRRPISTSEFPSNWELSTARAINVGKFLIEEGIPPERIAVAGFASFQPLDDRRDEIAYRRNRRIEIKLTTR